MDLLDMTTFTVFSHAIPRPLSSAQFVSCIFHSCTQFPLSYQQITLYPESLLFFAQERFPRCLSNGSKIDQYFPLFAPYLADITRGSSAVIPCIQLCDAVASSSACHFVRERNVTSFTDQAASGCGSLDCRPSVLHQSNTCSSAVRTEAFQNWNYKFSEFRVPTSFFFSFEKLTDLGRSCSLSPHFPSSRRTGI